MDRIEINDFADKNTTFVYSEDMKPLGYITCECATEWAAYDAGGKFINWFDTKKKAKAAL